MAKRKICVFSGKRGGFGAYLPLMRLIDDDSDLELQILLGDMHASEEFGATQGEVRSYFPNSLIEVISMGAGRGDSSRIRVENIGECLKQAGGVLEKLRPDILMVHGDRGEHLVMALAAVHFNIAVAHTQGGETSGNIDDIQRHAITKLAHIHFPETEKAAQRIIGLGEEQWRIYMVGSLYIDRIVKKMYTNPKLAREKYGLNESDYFIVIFHPDTYLSTEENYKTAKNIFSVVRPSNVRSIVIYPCSDPGYEGIRQAIAEIQNDKQFSVYKNIENLDFLGLMADAKAIIGNSSCAFVEAPYFHLPAINIGQREMGRDREENVVDADLSPESIKGALEYALQNPQFKKKLSCCGYGFGDGSASEKIIKVLKNFIIDKDRFFRKKLISQNDVRI